MEKILWTRKYFSFFNFKNEVNIWKNFVFSPFEERRKILEDNIKEIPGRIMLSEYTFVQVKKKLWNNTFLDDVK